MEDWNFFQLGAKMSDQLMCQIDHAHVRQGAIFAFGWVLHNSNRKIVSAELQIRDAAENLIVREVSVGKAREDVSISFPQNVHSGNSGWQIFSMLPSDRSSDAMLVFNCENGEKCNFPISVAENSQISMPFWQRVRYLFYRGVGYLATGKINILM